MRYEYFFWQKNIQDLLLILGKMSLKASSMQDLIIHFLSVFNSL